MTDDTLDVGGSLKPVEPMIRWTGNGFSQAEIDMTRGWPLSKRREYARLKQQPPRRVELVDSK